MDTSKVPVRGPTVSVAGFTIKEFHNKGSSLTVPEIFKYSSNVGSAREADMVGVGRPFYAEPDLARRFLEGQPGPGRCQNSNRCVPAQMLGMKGVCYNPAVTKAKTTDHAG